MKLVSAETVCALLRAGVPEAELERVLALAVGQGRPLNSVLLDASSELLDAVAREHLRREVDSVEMVRPAASLVELLPAGLCERLGAVPVQRDARSGRVDIAAVDPFDPHVERELGFHLEAPVRVLRARPEAMAAALAGFGPARVPSGPPLPLVRKAPQAVSPAPGDDEPVLSLSRPKIERTASSPTAGTVPPPVTEPMPSLLGDFENATSAEEIVALLLRGMAPAPTLVLSVRSGVYSGRAGSPSLEVDAVRRVRLAVGTASVVETAVRSGFYLGVLPMTPAHAPLRELFGGAAEHEVYVVPVMVSGHASLIVASEISPLGASVEATRRADQLAVVSAHALERIVVTKKRGH